MFLLDGGTGSQEGMGAYGRIDLILGGGVHLELNFMLDLVIRVGGCSYSPPGERWEVDPGSGAGS